MNEPCTATPTAAWRGSLLHYLDDPADGASEPAFEYIEDGLLLTAGGYISKTGPAQELLPGLPPDLKIHDRRGKLILPGFVDTHTHYVQTDVIASQGERLLDWLERYTFPAERAFADAGHGRAVARFFVDEMLRNGSTTALVMASVHPDSVDALFAEAEGRGMRLAAGKAMMDRNGPEVLCDGADGGYAETGSLIERWHRRGRLQYAISPRYAPTSSREQLAAAARLAAEHPDCLVHTHLAESEEEVAWVQQLFPDCRSYLDVYDRHGLLGPKTVLAHGIWLDPEDRARLADHGAAIAHCPTCNLFMGSGLFDLDGLAQSGVQLSLGTDIGGGTSFSLLRVMHEAYKVAHLRHQSLPAHQAFYLATLAGARALGMDAVIGNFLSGKEADFVVLDPAATPLLERRTRQCDSLEELLFVLMMLGDDRLIQEVYLMAQPAHPDR